jgi:hypothetical protein
LSGSLSSRELVVLKRTEAEYLNQQERINGMQRTIDSLNVTPNKDMEKYIDDSLNDVFESSVALRAMQYLNNVGDPTNDDYNFAYNLSLELSETQQMLQMWNQIYEGAARRGFNDIADRAKSLAQSTEESLEALEAMAFAEYGAIDTNLDYQKALQEERDYNDQMEVQLTAMRSGIGLQYNQAMARKMGQELQVMLSDQQKIRSAYDELLSGMQNEMDTVNQKYDYTLINIMYNRTRELDKQYEEALRQQ